MNENTGTIRDEYLDAAAGEAIGAATAEEGESLSPTPEEKRAAADLRETVARMAAASPYMAPPSELRGRILAATAPAHFKMEDYKKATRDDSKWWRYGVIAATLFLVAAAYYNISMQNQLKARDAQIAQMQQVIGDRNTALSMIADPKTPKAALKINDKVAGLLLFDNDKQAVVVVAPANVFPPGQGLQFETTTNGTKKTYRTIAITVDGAGDGAGVAFGKPMEARYYKDYKEDDQTKPMSASFGPGK